MAAQVCMMVESSRSLLFFPKLPVVLASSPWPQKMSKDADFSVSRIPVRNTMRVSASRV